MPPLTVSYGGFVNGDTSASLTTPPTVTTTATATSPAGRYAITAAGAADPDYAISYVPGVLAVVSTGPIVTQVQRYGFHMQATYLVLTFNGPLDPASAQNTANYLINGSTRQGRPSLKQIGVTNAIYDPAAGTVTLTLNARLDVHLRYFLTVNGSTASGLRNPSGELLQGAGLGQPGTNYVATITYANLAGRADQLPNASLFGLKVKKALPLRALLHLAQRHPAR